MQAIIRHSVKRVMENPGDKDALRESTHEVMMLCGEPQIAVGTAINMTALAEGAREKSEGEARKSEEKYDGLREKIEGSRQLAWLLSKRLEAGHNGTARNVMLAAPVGCGLRTICSVTPLEDADEQDLPAPLTACWIDRNGMFYLGPAQTDECLLPCDEHVVESVAPSRQVPGAVELAVDNGAAGGANPVLFAVAERGRQISDLLDQGNEVRVRAVDRIVRSIADAGAGAATPEWEELVDPAAPGLDSLALTRSHQRAWQRDLKKIARGGSVYVALAGYTGTGKSAGTARFASDAARLTGKPAYLMRISPTHIGSSYVNETERTLRRVFRRAQKRIADGAIVVILLDEATSLAGAASGRYEGQHDRRVREAFQELTGKKLAGPLAVILTLNDGPDSFLSPPIAQRFKIRRYREMRRSQSGRIGSLYVSDDVVARLGTTRLAFGKALADYLYNADFVVARVTTGSGTFPLPARSIRTFCNPARVEDLVQTLNDNAEFEDGEVSFNELYRMMEKDARAVTLNETNLYEYTFLSRAEHGQIRAVEPVRAGG
jgi:hypothetical protein